MKQVSIVIPVYNEKAIIAQTIQQIKQVTTQDSHTTYEIVIVNDCSSDGTGALLRSDDGYVLQTHQYNRGYGASLKTGIRASSYSTICIIDADGTYPIDQIPDLVTNFYDHELDMVVGARIKSGAAIPFERKYAKKFVNWFASYLAGSYIPDLNSGMRVFKKELVEKYWNLYPQRFSFTSTITMICATRGYKMEFFAIDYFKRVGKSSIRPTEFFRYIRLILKLSLLFNPLKVFFPLSLAIAGLALALPLLYMFGYLPVFYDVSFIIIMATALQTFFFGLLAKIITHHV